MSDPIQVKLQPKQGQLYDLMCATGPDAATIIGGGGAKGGGKSAGIRNIAMLLVFELGKLYPGLTVTIVRRVSDDLKKNHIDPLFRTYPELLEHYNKTDKEVIIPGYGRIVFAYAETEGDVKRKFLGGYESTFIFVDEAQQFTEEELQWIKTAARWTGKDGIPEGLCKVGYFFNPGGKGSAYIRRIFWTKEYTVKEKPRDFAFIHVFGWDNYEWFRGQVDIDEADFYQLDSDTRFQMFITQTSEGRKYDQFPESIRAGYLLGSFDHFEGQYFAGAWDAEKCVLSVGLVEKLIQPWWVRWMGQDWGFGDHTCHLWGAAGKIAPSKWMELFGGHIEQPMDVIIVYREYVINQRAEADMATDIVSLTPQAERKHIARFFLSQDAFGKTAKQAGNNTVGQAFADVMGRYGLPGPEPANQERVNGWRFLYNCFRQACLRGTNVHEERAKQGPCIFVSAECPELISSIPMAVRDPKNVDDVERVAGALWEDCCDGLRHLGYSFLHPLVTAPREVRAKELFASIPGTDDDAATARAMAMRKFELDNPVSQLLGKPRWRPNE